jgi:hypothetical protein
LGLSFCKKKIKECNKWKYNSGLFCKEAQKNKKHVSNKKYEFPPPPALFTYSIKNIKEIKKFIKRRDSFLPVTRMTAYKQEGCSAKIRAAKKDGKTFLNKYLLRNKNIKIVTIQCRVMHEKCEYHSDSPAIL